MQNLNVGLRSLVKRHGIVRLFNQQHKTETYYDILKLNQNCSQQDVRDAFVQLSKQHHPDMKGAKSDRAQTAQYVKILEAYQTLIKPNSRSAYDEKLRNNWNQPRMERPGHDGLHRPWEVKPDFDARANPEAYYGMEGVNRISNGKFVAGLILFGIFISLCSFWSIKESVRFNQRALDEKSAAAAAHHNAVRERAMMLGNAEQLRRLINQMQREDR